MYIKYKIVPFCPLQFCPVTTLGLRDISVIMLQEFNVISSGSNQLLG